MSTPGIDRRLGSAFGSTGLICRQCAPVSALSRIVKTYDVRGTVPDQLNEPIAEAIGRAFVQMLRGSGEPVDRVVTAHDMRESGPPLASAFAAGVTAEGASVVEAGLGSTDLLYFASGR